MPITTPAPSITCSVVSTDIGRATRFRGRLLSRDAIEGSYRFAIAKAGPSGKSAIQQGGRFVARANVETFVGFAAIGIESGAVYDVGLSIEVGGRTYACEPLTGGKV